MTMSLIIGGILTLVGVGWILIQAFRSSVMWGLGILIGAVVLPLVLSLNFWVDTVISFAIIGIFAAQHWEVARKPLVVLIVGWAVSVPGMMQLERAHTNAQEQAKTKSSTLEPDVASRPYTPSTQPLPSAIVPPPEPPRQKIAPQPQPVVEEPPPMLVAQVYADNKTKLYYEKDCANHPPNAYPMAKSLATKQGYKLAACP